MHIIVCVWLVSVRVRACPGCVGSSLEVECVREGAVRWCGGCGAFVVARLNPLPHASGAVAIEVVLDALLITALGLPAGYSMSLCHSVGSLI